LIFWAKAQGITGIPNRWLKPTASKINKRYLAIHLIKPTAIK
jgi:hypothetical protein